MEQRRHKRRARDWRVYRLRARHTRRAHLEHVAHLRDAGRVEVQRLVKLPRALCRVERRGCDTRREVRAGRCARGGARACVCQRGSRSTSGAHAEGPSGGYWGHKARARAASARRTSLSCS